MDPPLFKSIEEAVSVHSDAATLSTYDANAEVPAIPEERGGGLASIFSSKVSVTKPANTGPPRVSVQTGANQVWL